VRGRERKMASHRFSSLPDASRIFRPGVRERTACTLTLSINLRLLLPCNGLLPVGMRRGNPPDIRQCSLADEKHVRQIRWSLSRVTANVQALLVYTRVNSRGYSSSKKKSVLRWVNGPVEGTIIRLPKVKTDPAIEPVRAWPEGPCLRQIPECDATLDLDERDGQIECSASGSVRPLSGLVRTESSVRFENAGFTFDHSSRLHDERWCASQTCGQPMAQLG
jgi:hypothetical protein